MRKYYGTRRAMEAVGRKPPQIRKPAKPKPVLRPVTDDPYWTLLMAARERGDDREQRRLILRIVLGKRPPAPGEPTLTPAEEKILDAPPIGDLPEEGSL
jgi:hypothetical protein